MLVLKTVSILTKKKKEKRVFQRVIDLRLGSHLVYPQSGAIRENPKNCQR